MPKKRSISDSVLNETVVKYLKNKKKFNIAQLSKAYSIPYSTLRRYLLNYIQENGLADSLIEEHLPYDGFEYLRVGETFQFAEHLTLWYIKDIKNIDGDKVYTLVPTKERSRRHWVCDVLTEEGKSYA